MRGKGAVSAKCHLPEVEGVEGLGVLQDGRLAARWRVAIREVWIRTATVTK